MSALKSTLKAMARRPGMVARKLGKHPVLVLSVASLGYRCGKDIYRLRKGEFDRREFNARAGAHLGGVTGGFGGASAGAVIGSVVPGLGTLLGGFAGGIAGEYAGSKMGRSTIEFIRTWPLSA